MKEIIRDIQSSCVGIQSLEPAKSFAEKREQKLLRLNCIYTLDKKIRNVLMLFKLSFQTYDQVKELAYFVELWNECAGAGNYPELKHIDFNIDATYQEDIISLAWKNDFDNTLYGITN